MINISASSKCLLFHYYKYVLCAELRNGGFVRLLVCFCFASIASLCSMIEPELRSIKRTFLWPLSTNHFHFPLFNAVHFFDHTNTLRITFIVLSLSFLQQTLSLYASAANTSYLDEGGIVVWTLMIGLGDYKKFTSSKTGKMPPIL